MLNHSPRPLISSLMSQSLPQTFAEALMWVEGRILVDFDREIAQKQLYYHNRDHVNAVCRRASQLFRAIRPSLAGCPADTLVRLEGLLDLCAVAHDALKIFAPPVLPHTARRRDAGTSEAATIERLTNHITVLNQSLAPSSPARFTEEDLRIVREAIVATICVYDPADQAI